MEPTREELIAQFAAREAELIAQLDNALRVAEQAVFNAIKILRAGNHWSVEPHAIADCMQTDLAQHLDRLKHPLQDRPKELRSSRHSSGACTHKVLHAGCWVGYPYQLHQRGASGCGHAHQLGRGGGQPDDWQRLMSCPSAKTLCGLIMQLNLEVALMAASREPHLHQSDF